jgi:hypothetical protein
MLLKYSARDFVSISEKGVSPAYDSEHGLLLAPASVPETQCESNLVHLINEKEIDYISVTTSNNILYHI